MADKRHTFDAEKIAIKVRKRTEKAMNLALSDAVVDIQKRIDSGVGTGGERYKYSKSTAKKKGKSSPVDWTDTGILKRSIDFLSEITNNSVRGFIGIKNLKRGTTTNKAIHESLNKRFPNMWGLSKTEKDKFFKNFLRYFRS